MEEIKKDINGRTVIDMVVKDDTDFMSKFSKRDSQVISTEVADFIESSAKPINPKEPISLHVYSNCIDQEEQKLYRMGIRKYYSDCLVKAEREHKQNIIIALVLMFIGMATIALSLIIGSFGNPIWVEAIDIVAWVFCWEAVDIFFFKNRGLKIDKMRYSQLSGTNVEFYDLT